MTAPQTVGALPWYKSPVQISLVVTILSAVIAAFPKVGQALGLTAPGAIETVVQNVFAVIAVVAPIVGSFKRANSTVQPLTLTAAGAESHPATIEASEPHVIPVLQPAAPASTADASAAMIAALKQKHP